MNDSLLIGETIIYSPDTITKLKAVVLGTVTIRNKVTDIYPTSGYACLIDKVGSIKNIPYWQVIGIAEPDKSFTDLLNKEDKGVILSIYFPKFEKPNNPKGWDVDHESNDDLPY